MNKD